MAADGDFYDKLGGMGVVVPKVFLATGDHRKVRLRFESPQQRGCSARKSAGGRSGSGLVQELQEEL